MTTQLTLVHLPRPSRTTPAPVEAAAPASPWRLDERTRAVGRAGIAQARAVLAEARRPAEVPGSDEPAAA
ncbi:MAG: hypothetical protein MUE34_18105 [Acidimicrobiales bacterium]|jgi:hypothetical protein|nr:hypothetical protein [Acidimicrobiales bacterium]